MNVRKAIRNSIRLAAAGSEQGEPPPEVQAIMEALDTIRNCYFEISHLSAALVYLKSHPGTNQESHVSIKGKVHVLRKKAFTAIVSLNNVCGRLGYDIGFSKVACGKKKKQALKEADRLCRENLLL